MRVEAAVGAEFGGAPGAKSAVVGAAVGCLHDLRHVDDARLVLYRDVEPDGVVQHGVETRVNDGQPTEGVEAQVCAAWDLAHFLE